MIIPHPIMISLSSKGQIAIPKEFRAASGLEKGSKLIIEYSEDGMLILRPMKGKIESIFGAGDAYTSTDTTVSEEDAIMRVVAEEDEKTKRSSS